MELKLNIYKTENGTKTIEKTYTTTEYDVMFGTIEDLMQLLEIDKTGAKNDMEFTTEMVKRISMGFGQVKPLLLDIFPGLTVDELKRVKLKEVVKVFLAVIKSAFA